MKSMKKDTKKRKKKRMRNKNDFRCRSAKLILTKKDKEKYQRKLDKRRNRMNAKFEKVFPLRMFILLFCNLFFVL